MAQCSAAQRATNINERHFAFTTVDTEQLPVTKCRDACHRGEEVHKGDKGQYQHQCFWDDALRLFYLSCERRHRLVT